MSKNSTSTDAAVLLVLWALMILGLGLLTGCSARNTPTLYEIRRAQMAEIEKAELERELRVWRMEQLGELRCRVAERRHGLGMPESCPE